MHLGSFSVAKDIYLNQGIKGFYRGFIATLIRETPGILLFLNILLNINQN